MAQPEDKDALNGFFEENGFQSKSLVRNLGSTFIYICLYLLGYLLIGIFRCCKPASPKLLRFQTWLEKFLLWNSALRFVLQQFPPILISSLINLYYVSLTRFLNCVATIRQVEQCYLQRVSYGLQLWPTRRDGINGPQNLQVTKLTCL